MGKFDIKILGSMCDEWLAFYEKFDTFESAWAACDKGYWMLHIAFNFNIDRRVLTLAKGHCANTVRHLMEDERSIKAVDLAIAFGEGKATEKELDNAIVSAYAAYANAYDSNNHVYASLYAAKAAAYAIDCITAHIAAHAAYAAHTNNSVYSNYNSIAYNSNPALKENEKLTADICRKYLTKSVLEKIKEYGKEV
jgi:hypothetical protein